MANDPSDNLTQYAYSKAGYTTETTTFVSPNATALDSVEQAITTGKHATAETKANTTVKTTPAEALAKSKR